MKLLNGDELVLTYNLAALCALEEEFGGLENIEAQLEDKGHALRNTLTFIRIGMNGTIQRLNGMDGGRRSLYTNDQLAALIDRDMIGDLRIEISKAMAASHEQSFEIDEPAGKKDPSPTTSGS